MLRERKRLGILGFCVITLVLSIGSVLSPWWKVATKQDAGSLGKSMSAEYWLTGTVSASRITQNENETVSLRVPFENMSTSSESVGALSSLCTITLTVSTLALVLNISTLAFITVSLFVGKRRFLPFVKYTAAAAALLFLIATVYFASVAQPTIARLESVLPSQVHVLAGNKISDFWGGIKITTEHLEWTWGPAFGWFLSFVAFIMNGFIPQLRKRAF